MKRLLIFLLLSLCSLTSFVSFADDTDDDTPKYPLPKKEIPVDPGIYLAPVYSENVKFCYNCNRGFGTFYLPFGVINLDIQAENLLSHVIFFGTISFDNPFWEQPLPVGEYYIECTADNGDVYAGYVYI
ncbi:MAG: hypothetical protein HDS72_08170 [Bacteroidales bacterium]|nr:hypothetical protein [Bacteroidales bacterium]